MKRLIFGPKVLYYQAVTSKFIYELKSFFNVILMPHNGFRYGYVNFFHEKKLWEFLKSKLNFLVLCCVAAVLIMLSVFASMSGH